MKISIFGLGYVGTVSAACFAKEGHKVIGVDIAKSKVELINIGKTPIIEKDLETILFHATEFIGLSSDTTLDNYIANLEITWISTKA